LRTVAAHGYTSTGHSGCGRGSARATSGSPGELSRPTPGRPTGTRRLNVPFDSGIAFVRASSAHRAAMTTRASYLIAVSDDADPAQAARDQIDWNPEWSRRGRGVPVYAAIRALGREGVRGIVERCGDHTRRLVAEIGALPGAEALVEPQLNQGADPVPVRGRQPRPPHRRGDRADSSRRRGLVRWDKLERHARHARVGDELAYRRQRRRADRPGCAARAQLGACSGAMMSCTGRQVCSCVASP
jgi:hypothetical protein